MRLTHVSLYANEVEALTFSLRVGTTNNKFEVRTMLGLDADELVPKFYAFSLVSRQRYYEFAMKPREIVIRLKLNPRYELDESYSDIRDDLYRAISSSRTGEVTLLFNRKGTTMAKISGFITKFEVPHFTPLPEAQFTIRCDDPMLRGTNPVQYNPATFGTENPVIMGDSLSTAPHGFQMQVEFTATEPNFIMQEKQTDPEWRFIVVPSGGFISGDILYISSEYNEKTVYMVRGATTTLLVDRIEPGSVWPVIFPGANEFWIPDLASIDWNLIEYYPAYWGI